MRQLIYPAGRALGLAVVITSVILYCITFVRSVGPIWGLIPFGFWISACLLAGMSRRQGNRPTPSHTAVFIFLLLLVYAVGSFIYFYRVTNGATDVSVIDGNYVALRKGQVISMISQAQYLKFPALETRVLSAWWGMLSSLILLEFPARREAE